MWGSLQVGAARGQEQQLLRQDARRPLHREAAVRGRAQVLPGAGAQLLWLLRPRHALRAAHLPRQDHGRLHGRPLLHVIAN